MKNKEINQITEEEYREETEEIGPYDYDDPFPMDPDEDNPYSHDRILEEDFKKYQKELQKEAEEEEYRRRFWQPEYDLSGDEIIRD